MAEPPIQPAKPRSRCAFECIVCGVTVPRLNSKQKRCPPCQAKHRAAYVNAHKRRPESAAKIRERTRKYREARRDHVSAVFWEWSQKNKERLRETRRAYRAANAEKIRHQKRLRRKRAQKAGGSHTVEQFVALCEAQGWKCSYCRELVGQDEMTADHKIPLVRGGTNAIENIAPACRSCNSKKYNRTPEEFAELMKRRQHLRPSQRGYRLPALGLRFA